MDFDEGNKASALVGMLPGGVVDHLSGETRPFMLQPVDHSKILGQLV
jgi:hypothetical protein